MTGTTLRRRRLSEETADRILGWLSEAPADAPLPSEREIALRLGVGRSTVREALQRLERSGLVQVRQGERMRGAPPTAEALIDQLAAPARRILSTSPRSLDDLKEARLLLEGAVVRLACERADAAALAAMRACQARLVACAARLAAEDGARFDHFLAEDMAFHVALGRATGNAILAAVVQATCGFLSGFHEGLVRLRGAEALTIAEHAAILAAVEARDAGAAVAAMQAHLARADQLYRVLEQAGPERLGDGPGPRSTAPR